MKQVRILFLGTRNGFSDYELPDGGSLFDLLNTVGRAHCADKMSAEEQLKFLGALYGEVRYTLRSQGRLVEIESIFTPLPTEALIVGQPVVKGNAQMFARRDREDSAGLAFADRLNPK